MKDLKDILAFSGFRKLAMKYAGFGVKELARSIFPSLQVKQVQKYIQEITSADVERGPAGVRAQAMAKDGNKLFLNTNFVIGMFYCMIGVPS